MNHVAASDLEKVVRQAGTLLMSFFGTPSQIERKEDSSLVTEADKASELYLLDSLQSLLPGAAFWSEEAGRSGDSDYCWVIDPLDGTNNFIHGIPLFCVAVALTYKNKPVQAAIYQPAMAEFFYAVKDMGAFFNGRRLQVDTVPWLDQTALLALPDTLSHQIKQTLQKRGIHVRHRYFGSVSVEMTAAACGRLDGVIYESLPWWDRAAGTLLMQEAGLLVTDSQGGAITPENPSCRAARQELYHQLSGILQKAS